jgi:AcrR family transcriptional regulator
MSTQIRKYEMKARAESQRETRDRIAQAAMELHEEKGVAKTTVAEIARRAGVTRVTVYNHFADLSELIPACSAHYEMRHPLPDFAEALALEDADERVRTVLGGLYAWYSETEPMFAKLFSDRATVPELDDFLKGGIDLLQTQLADALTRTFGARGKRAKRLRGLAGVATDFWTWHRLQAEGLSDDEAAEAMTVAVAAGAA